MYKAGRQPLAIVQKCARSTASAKGGKIPGIYPKSVAVEHIPGYYMTIKKCGCAGKWKFKREKLFTQKLIIIIK